jgi:ABC-type branched-subunit amino acid transport system substrate-binding protein
MLRALAVLGAALAAAACYGSTQPIVKLGLIAPFEEAHRAEGYAVLDAVKLAIGERNASGGVAGRQVALVALNDNGRPDEAAMQAAKLAVDRDVLGVVGPLSEATAAAAGPILAAEGLAWIALVDTTPVAAPVSSEFAASYRARTGAEPTAQAARAYEATVRLLDAFERAGRSGLLSRESVRQAYDRR